MVASQHRLDQLLPETLTSLVRRDGNTEKSDDPVELDADPTRPLAGVGEARHARHPREDGVQMLLNVGAAIAVRPGLDPLGRSGVGNRQFERRTRTTATSCVSPVMTTTACWMLQPRAESSSSNGTWISNGLTCTPQSMP